MSEQSGRTGEADKARIRALLDEAVDRHRAGDFPEARALYEQVLVLDPEDANSLTNLGTICCQTGDVQQGIVFLERSLTVKPDQAHALSNLANALNMTGQFEKARTAIERSVALQPDNADAYNNLGNVRRELGDTEGALEAYEYAFALNPTLIAALGNEATMLRAIRQTERAIVVMDRALRAAPDYADGWNERGNSLQDLRRFEEALESYRKAIEFNPQHVEAMCNSALALTSLGRHEEALALCERAIAIRPDHPDIYNARGNALRVMERPAEAVPDLRKAIALQPTRADAHNSLGIALNDMRRHEEALAMFDRAIQLNPRFAEAHANRGNVMREMRRWEEALDEYDAAIAMGGLIARRDSINNKAITLHEMRRHEEALALFDEAWAVDPDYSDAPWNKAIVYIVTQRYEEGWRHYEWRWKRAEFKDKPNPYGKMPWLGGRSIAGKKILVTSEQGLGDTLQMLRYGPLLAELGAEVTVAVQNPLIELAWTVPGVTNVLGEGETLPPWDEFVPSMSLPYAFRTRADSVPQNVPYLSASPEAKAKWAQRLGRKTRPRIGLTWSGNKGHKNDHNRSVPLRLLEPLLDLDADFISLMIDYRDGDKAVLMRRPEILDLSAEITSLMDTAGLMEQLDLVISVDTSVAHLAGALNKPLWLMLPYTPDYRWHLDTPKTPWYPSATLVRQDVERQWEPVVTRLKAMAEDWLRPD
jgi:tetratricopeptide (TPR) repeat protein